MPCSGRLSANIPFTISSTNDSHSGFRPVPPFCRHRPVRAINEYCAIWLSLGRSARAGSKLFSTGRRRKLSTRSRWKPVNLDSGRFGSSGIATNSVHLQNDKLMEVELQYEYPDLSIERYNEQMERFAIFDGQVWGRQISLTLARHERTSSDAGWLPMDGGHDHARALLFFSGKTAAHLSAPSRSITKLCNLNPTPDHILFLSENTVRKLDGLKPSSFRRDILGSRTAPHVGRLQRRHLLILSAPMNISSTFSSLSTCWLQC